LHRLGSAVLGYLPVGGLMILWLGVIAVGWISLDWPAAKTDTRHGSQPSTDRIARAQTPGQAAEKASPKPAPDAVDTDAPSGPDTASTPADPVVQTNVSKNPSAQAARPPAGNVADSTTSRPNNPPQATANPPNETSSSHTQSPSMTASNHVTRAQFTSGIENHEPVDHLGDVFHSHNQPLRHLYYFTDFSGLGGQRVTYHWRHGGRAIASVTFTVGSNRWRAYSSKRLIPAMAGRWTVVVTDDNTGQTLSKASIVYKVP
jgi:hypothetical protein